MWWPPVAPATLRKAQKACASAGFICASRHGRPPLKSCGIWGANFHPITCTTAGWTSSTGMLNSTLERPAARRGRGPLRSASRPMRRKRTAINIGHWRNAQRRQHVGVFLAPQRKRALQSPAMPLSNQLCQQALMILGLWGRLRRLRLTLRCLWRLS